MWKILGNSNLKEPKNKNNRVPICKYTKSVQFWVNVVKTCLELYTCKHNEMNNFSFWRSKNCISKMQAFPTHYLYQMQLPSVALYIINYSFHRWKFHLKKEKKVQQYVDSMVVMAERNSNSLCGFQNSLLCHHPSPSCECSKIIGQHN